MTRYQRAQQLWSILVLSSRYRHILTYGELAKACGVPAAALGGFLEPVQRWCLAKKLPALTSLVVNETTGLPGIGFTAAADVPSAQMAVFRFDWLSERAPSAEEFEGN